MVELLKFFKNAIKAIIFSPYYILYFVFSLLVSFFMYIYGEILSVFLFFSGSGYRQEQYNEYDKLLKTCKKHNASYDVIKQKGLD